MEGVWDRGGGVRYEEHRYTSQLEDTFYQGMQESITISTYYISIII